MTEGRARLLASGSFFAQLAQVAGLVAIFAVITVLARRLSLAEMGVYGLLSSLAGYLLIVQNAGAGAAVRAMAVADSAERRDEAFSTAVALYAVAGVACGALVAALGIAATALIDLPDGLADQARDGSLLLGAVTAVGWPATVWRDALRSVERYVRVAVAEMVAVAAWTALVVGLALSDASLAVLVGASGAIPLLAGLACAVAARLARIPHRVRPGLASRRAAGDLGGLAAMLTLAEAAIAAVYVVDRAILGALGSASAVGQFEGPVRAHNLLRSLNSAVTVTVLPAASRLVAEGDRRRLAELLVRGSRYTLALIAPIAVVGAVLAAPLLDAWLGPEYRAGGAAMAILLVHWLVNGASGVAAALLVGLGSAVTVARWAVAVALTNVALALALVPWLEVEGAALATTIPFAAAFPYLMGSALRATATPAAELWRRAFKPALALCVPLAVVLGALRLAAEPEGAVVFALAIAGVTAYWTAYYLLLLGPGERALVRGLARPG